MIGWLLARPRLALYGLAGAALLAGGITAWVQVSRWRSAYVALPAVAAERDAALRTVQLAADEADRNARIANAYHDQLDRLRADLRDRPIRVRVCESPARPVLPPGAAPGTHAPAPGPVAGTPAPAPGPRDVDLTGYAEDAAATADQLRALQQWVRERP